MRAIDGDILEKKLKDAINMCMSIDTSGLSELKAVLEDVEEMPTIEPHCETCEAFNKTRLLIPQPERKTGRWRHYEGCLTCSECGIEYYADIMAYCGDNVPKFCPNCGADMREDAEEAKKCDTCKHEKERWFSRCADCSDYELWEGKQCQR